MQEVTRNLEAQALGYCDQSRRREDPPALALPLSQKRQIATRKIPLMATLSQEPGFSEP